MGTAHLYGSDRSIRDPACGAAGIHGTRTGKNLIVYCMPAKDYPADPDDLYPAAFLYR